MKRILVVTLLLLASGQAVAAFYNTGYLRELLDSCNGLPETFDANKENFSRIKDCGLSTAYILGVFDTLDVTADRSLCLPRTVRSEQVVETVEHWLENNPGRENQPADESVKAAFSEAWRCAD